MLGEVRRVGADGEPHTLMILQGYLNNQGDAWNWTLDNLERAVRDEISAASEALEGQYDSLAELRGFAANLGARLGEMHSVLAGESDDPPSAAARATKPASRPGRCASPNSCAKPANA